MQSLDSPPPAPAMKRSRSTVRRVWRAISLAPQASCRALASQLRLSPSSIAEALAILRLAGYIDYQHGAERARRVIIPFYALEQKGDA